MHRIDGDAQYPPSHFSEGDPLIPRSPTQVTAAWLDNVQEELVGMVFESGFTLIKGAVQLRGVIANLTTTQTFTALKTFAAGITAAASTFTGLLTAQAGVTASGGDIKADVGNVVATAGDVVATVGDISAPLGTFRGLAAHVDNDVGCSGISATGLVSALKGEFVGNASGAPLRLIPRLVTGDPPVSGWNYQPSNPQHGDVFIHSYSSGPPRLCIYVNGGWWHCPDFTTGLS